MKSLRERELGSLTFAAGQTSTLQLPRDFSLAKLQFRLVTQLDRGIPTGVKDLSGAQLVKRIEVRRNGRDVLKALDFETLMRLNQQRYKTAPQRTISNAAWDSGLLALNDVTFDLSAILDFAMWGSLRPNDTLLDCTARGNVSTLDLLITWGTGLDVLTGGATVTVDSCTLYVSSTEYIDVDDASDPYTPYSDNREYGIRKVIAATNPKEQIQLGVGNFYRSFVLKATVDGALSNAVINSVILKSGTDVIKYRLGPGLRNDNKLELGLETMPDGYYLLELVKDGHLAKMLNTTNMSSLELELDVTKSGTTTIVEVFPVEVVPAARRVA